MNDTQVQDRCRRAPPGAWAVPAALLVLGLSAGPAAALQKVTFGTDWKAQAEHGGFYQAKAEGRYEKCGLDVTIHQGGPQVNHAQLLAAGAVDFAMSPNTAFALNYVANDIPVVTVAAMFQKDPQVLIAHPGQGHDTIEGMKGAPIMISGDTRETWWRFLKAKYGFTDDQIRPYTFQLAPFLADPTAIQQGYLSSEPYMVRQQGIEPVTVLLADTGWPSYSSMVSTKRSMVEEHPDWVKCFVNASIEGFYSYLYGDPSPANALIKADNPEMTDDIIANAIKEMKAHGIVDSGDALEKGIGAMSWDRLEQFFNLMADAGAYPKDMDWRKGFVMDFVNQGHGKEMRK